MKKARRVTLAILGLLAIVILTVLQSSLKNTDSTLCPTVVIKTSHGTEIHAEIANTDAERRKGLSDREAISPFTGMLFLFPKSDVYAFWMKDTHIPLDIIWLQDKKIVEMTSLAAESTAGTPQYTPRHSANAVLELGQGAYNRFQLAIGDRLTWEDCSKGL